jgi:hypothetical protein
VLSPRHLRNSLHPRHERLQGGLRSGPEAHYRACPAACRPSVALRGREIGAEGHHPDEAPRQRQVLQGRRMKCNEAIERSVEGAAGGGAVPDREEQARVEVDA